MKPNWNIFRTKFNDSTTNFEYFCYLLFCIEFNRPYGIFRYKNQSGIESEPVEIDGRTIGFQAKFYDDKLANKKTDLLKMLKTIHENYPKLNELKLYTNRDWGQGNKERESKPKQEIEKKAKEYNINIDWRTDEAYFQSINVSLTNKDIADHFFSMESIYDIVEEKQNHTRRILENVNSQIQFNSRTIELDRSTVLSDLNDKLHSNQIVIINGVGGVGKTAVIKKLYEQKEKNTPFYLFKAGEFNKSNVNELFGKYNIEKFIDIHKVYDDKIVVIDSSEKLLDIYNLDVFKEFLDSFIKNKWKIIFTTRDGYLVDLYHQFSDILNIQPINISINNLDSPKLIEISEKFKFNLPNDIKLEVLVRNPFYLNEYLISYKDNDEIDYKDFKQKIWAKKIKSPNDEQYFLKLAFLRVEQGQFYINIDCSSDSLENLRKEGVLTYEKSLGDFISHDIYEEWALERIINREFIRKTNNKSFFEEIGSSLAIRRVFRSWVSEKLLLNDENIIDFIEDIIDSHDIESSWKDEIFISILLSNYSDTFFKTFDREIKDNNFELLIKLSSLLQLSCKEVDNSLIEQYRLIGVQKLEIFQLLNMPKGNGWKSFITFVFNNIETIKIENINIILPLLLDWNKKYKKGETTRFASLLALHYYKLIYQDKYSYNESIEKICNIIISGANEIHQELEEIFKNIIENKLKNNEDIYYELSIKTLSTEEGLPLAFPILTSMPNHVLKLANLFWTNSPMKETNSPYLSESRDDVENAYDLDNNYELNCFPPSTYQTPIYYMLHIDFSNTIDFVLEFINKSVEHYVKSTWKYKEEIQTINLQIDDKITIDQYHSSALWNTFRGTSSPISPYLLQSIHMGLETYLLEVSKDLEHNDLEKLLANILYKSKSSSISAIIASVVLAYPSKTTNIAIALFKTKEFIQSDLLRQIEDMSAKSQYSMGYGLNKSNRVYINERLETCKDKHRNSHLEKQFLDYQYCKLLDFKSKDKESVNELIENLYKILDTYKAELDVNKDKDWQIALSRMDMRDMTIETRKDKDGIQLTVTHELPSELKKHSEIVENETTDIIKYLRLNLCASNKIKGKNDTKKYKDFEENPLLALTQIKEILDIPVENRDFILQEEIFPNVSVCLLKYYKKSLSKEDIELCKDLILEFSKKQFSKNYSFQFSDGTEVALSNLPILLEDFPDLNDDIKIILLFSLFNDYEIGMSVDNIHDYPINAIVDFYDEKEINDFILGYLFLKPKYDLLYLELSKENYQINKSDVIDEFFKIYKDEIDKFVISEITIGTIDFNMNFVNLSTIFKFIKSSKVKQNDLFRELSKKSILRIFQPKKRKKQSLEYMTRIEKLNEKFASNKRYYEDIDFRVKQRFISNLPYLIFKLEISDINKYLEPLLDNFSDREDISYLLFEFITVQDRIKEYDKFWCIWNLFEDRVSEICKNGKYGYIAIIIKTYLLAWSSYGEIWNNNAKEWHSLRYENKRFFKRISIKIGHCPSTLYSISKLLTSVGSIYLNDGILWIANMLKNNSNLYKDELEVNTLHHIETFVKKYIFENTKKIKKEREIKENILIILDFLIKKESSFGYKLRDKIL